MIDVSCLCGCVSSNVSQITTHPTVFCLILVKLGAHDLHANKQKKLWNRFSKFYFKIFGKFFTFQIWAYSLEQ